MHKLPFFIHALLVTGVVTPVSFAAQPVETIAPVVVTATRSETTTLTVPASIEVITRDEIARTGAPTLGDLLRGRGALSVSDLYGDGSEVTVGMRGFSESAHSNTLILVDGRRLNHADIDAPSLSIIPLGDVERIEIVRGSAGTLFGDQAVGGVINIITRQPDRFRARAKGFAGHYGLHGLRASIGERLPNGLFFRLAGEDRQSDNYRDHNALDYRHASAKAGFAHSKGSVYLEYLRTDERLETPGALTPAEAAVDRRQSLPVFSGDVSETDTRVQRLAWDQGITRHWAVEGELSRRRTEGEFITSFRGFPATDANTRDYTHWAFTPRLVGEWSSARGTYLMTLGYDRERADLEFLIPGFFGLKRDNEQDVEGLYGQAVVPLVEGLSVTLGARWAQVENAITDSSAFPNGVRIDDDITVTELGFNYRPDEAWRLFLRRDGNFRFAKVDELAGAAPGTVLDTQTGVSWEAGAEFSARNYEVRALLYRLRLEDEIAYDPTAPGPFAPFSLGANVNFDETLRRGLVLEGTYRVSSDLRVEGAYTFTDARFESGVFAGNRVSYVPENTLRVALDYRLGHGWGVHGEFVGVDEQFLSGDNANRQGKQAGYGVLNMAVELADGPLTVGARINNLTGTEYAGFATSFGSVWPAPGTNVQVTASYEFQ